MKDTRIELEHLDIAVEVNWDSDKEWWELILWDRANKGMSDSAEWSDHYPKDQKAAAIGDGMAQAEFIAEARDDL